MKFKLKFLTAGLNTQAESVLLFIGCAIDTNSNDQPLIINNNIILNHVSLRLRLGQMCALCPKNITILQLQKNLFQHLPL